MSFPNERTYNFDAAMQVSDNAAAYTATGNLQVGGVDAVLDLGGNQSTSPKQQARIDAALVLDVTAIDVASGDETYQIDVLLSNDPAFASGNAIAAGIQLGKGTALRNTLSGDSVTGRYELMFTNELAGTKYQYMKALATLGGTTPSISIEAFVAVLPEP